MKKLIIGLLLSVATFVLVCVGSVAYLFAGQEKREVVTVPDFEGRIIGDTFADTRFLIENEGVYCERKEGEIIAQTPPAGAKRKLAKGEKCRVRLKVSLGEKRETIPKILGFNYIEAANILRELGLSVRIMPVYGEGKERDRVIRSSPEVGSTVSVGDEITLFVARDRIKESVRVGDYVGMEKGEAVSRLLADGLCIAEITEERSTKFPRGTVVDQSIKSGAYVPYGSEISLTVCCGEDKAPPRFRFGWGKKIKTES